MNRADKAAALFQDGYNCAQAVLGAFAEDLGLPLDTAMKLSSSFGGGMGRMREVCGACSGMFMAAGLLYGYATPETGAPKKELYEHVRALADRFREENGSIICRELLGGEATVGGTPEARTEAYYKKRPCVEYVRCAAAIFEAYQAEQTAKE
ncbi:MAG: C_GCAxxG_C_C family protein [Clostridia bacterium]|nr:C_GCAxxG_C_C family protein [Clostridia bacterium]